ncbi:MAG: hypothetical protein KY468_18945 [Armatimonadetes bacterium]|nr:hypothetical protein [Armatimonadota bacterium]
MTRVPRIAWILLAGLAAMAGILLLLPPPSGDADAAGSGGRVNSSASPREAASALGSSAESTKRPVRPLAAYDRLRQRNLFNPLVKPDTASLSPSEEILGLPPLDSGLPALPPLGRGGLFPSAALPASAKPLPTQNALGSWAYVGYASEDGLPGAVLENKAERQGRIVRVGDRVEGALITGITRQRLLLQRNGKSFLLLLTDPLEAAKNAKPASPANAAPPGAPAPPKPGAAPPGGPNPGPPSGPSPAPAPPQGGPPRPATGPTPAPPPVIIHDNDRKG